CFRTLDTVRIPVDNGLSLNLWSDPFRSPTMAMAVGDRPFRVTLAPDRTAADRPRLRPWKEALSGSWHRSIPSQAAPWTSTRVAGASVGAQAIWLCPSTCVYPKCFLTSSRPSLHQKLLSNPKGVAP